jgi:hypothetical protein
MKNVLCSLVVGLTLLSGPVHAESSLPGTSFDLMPKGCRIHGVYSDGKQVIDEYTGLRKGAHIVRTFGGPKGRTLIRTTTYNAEGFMVRKDWAGGEWETFTPFSCFDRVGKCTYTYRNGDGANQIYRGTVSRKKDRIVSRGGFEGEPPFVPSVITPGPFNFGAAFTEGDTSFRVTRYENCGNDLPSQ